MLWLFFLFFDEMVILYLCSSYLAGFCTSAASTGFHVFALKFVHVSSRLKVRLHQSAVHSVWACPRSPFKEHYASVIIMSSSWTAHYSVYEDNRNSSSCIWTWRKELLCEPGFIYLAWISVIRPIQCSFRGLCFLFLRKCFRRHGITGRQTSQPIKQVTLL